MKINFVALGCVSNDVAERNVASCKARNLPEVSPSDCFGEDLAIVGGGPSVREHIAELREWQGDVWAINGAYAWCERNEIEAGFFSIDPIAQLANDIGNAPRVFLASCCDPAAFDAADGSIVRTFDIGPGKLLTGATSATAAAAIAPRIGYRRVTGYGLEGSYWQGLTHAYAGGITHQCVMRVRCGGTDYLTDPGLFMQCEFLAALIRAAPGVYRENCGGLLRAMVEHDDADVVAVSQHMMAAIRPAA